MNVSKRRAVSPIIATLLLIAITVAAGVIVYVFVTGLSGNLTKSGGNQVTEQISLDSYNFQFNSLLTLYLRNTGTSSVTISQVYFNGAPAQFYGSCGLQAITSVGTNIATTTATAVAISAPTTTSTTIATAPVTTVTTTEALTSGTNTITLSQQAPQSPQGTCQINVFGFGPVSAGTSYQVKIVTIDGGAFPINVVAGSTG